MSKAPVRWAYGVTTVPARRDDLLPRTLASLRAAGFDRPRLFVDGCDDNPTSWVNEFGLEVTARTGPPVRTAGSWVLALWELYARDPSAHRFAVFQDDVLAYRNLRGYLDSLAIPEDGYWNLYTFPWVTGPGGSPGRQAPPPAGHPGGFYRSNQMGRGALGLVFGRQAVISLLGSGYMADRFQDAHRGHRSVDGAVVTAMKRTGYTEWVHDPTLLQHTGEVSSMGNVRHPTADSWRGEGFDATELLGDRAGV